jgi:hypothetical protein
MVGDKMRLLKFALALVSVTALSVSAVADVGIRYTANGYQQITSLSAATALTVPTGSTTAVIIAEAQAVRYRDDGTDPSASVGMPMAVGVTLTYTGPLSKIKFIEQTGGAKLNISYYR